MKYIILLLLPLFAACNHQPTVPDVQKIEVYKKVQVPAELLQSCRQIAQVYPEKLDNILMEDLDIIQLYGECRARHKTLVESIQEVVK